MYCCPKDAGALWRPRIPLACRMQVIAVLGTGSNYYQHFDCVTVLYADVVRYTSAKPQQGDAVPTLEVRKCTAAVKAKLAAARTQKCSLENGLVAFLELPIG